MLRVLVEEGGADLSARDKAGKTARELCTNTSLFDKLTQPRAATPVVSSSEQSGSSSSSAASPPSKPNAVLESEVAALTARVVSLERKLAVAERQRDEALAKLAALAASGGKADD